MKKLYFLFFLTIGFFANAQIVNIPDTDFKLKLLSASPTNLLAKDLNGNYFKIDSNNDSQIQISEAQQVSYLDVTFSSIDDLSGIENFTNLLYLKIDNNYLTSIEVSSLINLIHLSCTNNSLTSLNVSTLTNLEDLNFSNNLISNIVLTNLTNLKFLSCDNNSLTTLDTSTLINLETLFCSSNQLTSLDLSQNIILEWLRCFQNQLTNLNVMGLTNLSSFDCHNNQLTTLDVSGCQNLGLFLCFNNQLTNLNLTGCVNLNRLECYSNQLTSLDLFDKINLRYLECGNNNLTSLDISGCTNAYEFDLSCGANQLLYLNLKNGNRTVPINFEQNPNLKYICADENEISTVQSEINSIGYPFATTCHVNTYCSFVPGGIYYDILGTSKLDFNNNGCDDTDVNYSNLRYNITNGTTSGSIISNQTGNYHLPVSAGNYTLTPIPENPTYFNFSPPNRVINFPTQTSPFTQNFCVTANGAKSDVEVVLLPTNPARPGFDARYKLVFRNKGNQVENGSVNLNFDDSRLDYVSSNPAYNNSVLNNLTWNFTNLQPFESREIDLILNVNSPMEVPAVNIGNILNHIATISISNTDLVSIDNSFTLEQTVVGSYDPNDKTCLQGTTITPSEVGKYVHYLIRFENTGTYPAENIVVSDIINSFTFDISSLIPLKSSHDFYTRINGNKVEFIFENINLDFNDETNDGYVSFKIKTKSTLVVGNWFTNNAKIYFDYNFPITTNTYTTTVTALSTQDFDFGTYFTLYPNPTKDVLNIQAKQGVETNSIEIYNQLGQVVMAVTNAINSVDVSSLASGTYFVKINSEKGSANAKFVKE